jgi:hypothetical protein
VVCVENVGGLARLAHRRQALFRAAWFGDQMRKVALCCGRPRLSSNILYLMYNLTFAFK